MNILIIGSGSREHAIAWKLSQSSNTQSLYISPGNAGTASLGTNLHINTTDFDKLIKAVNKYHINLTIVGPEIPLSEGIVDYFEKENVPILGPTQRAAEIESSKLFANDLMSRNGIPTAQSEVFTSTSRALAYIQKQSLPIVVKANGLAAGKGVVVASTYAEAETMTRICLDEKRFGQSGEQILIEEYLEGREVSVFAFSDGLTISPLIAACDYKRAFDNNRGPNTGGMGAYSSPEFWDMDLSNEIQSKIMEPITRALANEGRTYKGILYGGLMLTKDGPRVIEFNCRFGDPEAQVVLPRLENDLSEVAQAIVEGELRKLTLTWNNEACVGVVMASGGYPGTYQVGQEITGLDSTERNAMIFHAGTKLTKDGRILSDGGRVLTVVGSGSDLTVARQRAYQTISNIHLNDAFYRKDIANIRTEDNDI
jgi:phosphoribosylamine--glycine ligase